MEHHDVAVEQFVSSVLRDPVNLAVIVTGSVARGTPRPDSDVDVYLLVKEDEFERARASERLSYVIEEGVDYPGGYIDVKVATESYLEAAAARGDDPVRASFVDSFIAWSRIDGLVERVRAITELPEALWEQRMTSFIAQTRLYGAYFLPQGEMKQDPMLTHYAAVHLAFAAGRALLALNRVLFQGPKYLMSAVGQLPRAPEGFTDLMAVLLAEPSSDRASDLALALEGFHSWPLAVDATLSRFVSDNELAWLTRTAPPEFS